MAKIALHKNNGIGIAEAAYGTRRWTDASLGKGLADAANAGDQDAVRIVAGLVEGAPIAFRKRLDSLMEGFRIVLTPKFPASRYQLHWYQFLEHPTNRGPGNNTGAYAVCALRMIDAGKVNWFGVCHAPRPNSPNEICGKFYFRDPRSKTCSARCLSRMRVAKFRARKKRGRK